MPKAAKNDRQETRYCATSVCVCVRACIMKYVKYERLVLVVRAYLYWYGLFGSYSTKVAAHFIILYDDNKFII